MCAEESNDQQCDEQIRFKHVIISSIDSSKNNIKNISRLSMIVRRNIVDKEQFVPFVERGFHTQLSEHRHIYHASAILNALM